MKDDGESSIKSGPVKNVLQLIGAPDGDPNVARQVRFWFYSGEEAVIYRLASALQKRGYGVHLEKRPELRRWLCIGDIEYTPAREPFRNLCGEMLLLTRQYEVIFEGWEMVSPEN